MRRNLTLQERHRLRATCLPKVVKREARPLPRVHGSISLHVRQGEVRLAIASIGRPKQGEKRRVLREWKDLTVTERPSLGRKVERENANLCHKRVHVSLLGLRREDAKQRNDEVDAEVRLEVVVRLTSTDRANSIGG